MCVIKTIRVFHDFDAIFVVSLLKVYVKASRIRALICHI